ncbi:hypothetical protein ABEB36_000402 [Hypothenemus hampei]|uniref:DDE Tnp4 domain-containing protein n=1 Tax=Hypothenemus hampei TaxID=57062 RepID=A0ABD1FB54_HYPHA
MERYFVSLYKRGTLFAGDVVFIFTRQKKTVVEIQNNVIEDGTDNNPLSEVDDFIWDSDTSTSTSEDFSDVTVKYTTNEQHISTKQLVCMEIDRTVITHRYCIICGCPNNFVTIPEKARFRCYVKRRIFIPSGNRCCPSHLSNDLFFIEDLNRIQVYSSMSQLSCDELSQLMGKLTVNCDKDLLDKVADFSMSEEQLKLFMSLNADVVSMSVSVDVKTPILQLSNKWVVSEYVKLVRKAFIQDIISKQFGCKHTSNEKIMLETSPLARQLYDTDTALMLICDGTYARHQKSTNNEYQRKSFSGQKKVPLCKPFTICTTIGYIVDMLGPYTANENDARNLTTIMECENAGLSDLMRVNDISIFDRGFRDVVDYLKNKGYVVSMPALKAKRKKLTSVESNQSRLVTKCRWVVEAVHGILKQKYQLLDRKIDNKIIPKIGDYFRIASFLQNQFGKRLIFDIDTSEAITVRMKSLVNTENTLSIEVENEGWARKKIPFVQITSNVLENFPQLTESELKILFTGSYQCYVPNFRHLNNSLYNIILQLSLVPKIL